MSNFNLTMGSIPNDVVNEEHLLVVGTFNTPELFVIGFAPSTSTLTLHAVVPARGNHSWLGLNEAKDTLLATCWTEPPSIASYAIDTSSSTQVRLIDTQDVQSRSGYVTCRSDRAYTAGGPAGEVMSLDVKTKKLTSTLQEINYVTGAVRLTDAGAALIGAQTNGHDEQSQHVNGVANGKRENVLDFGGLRHGAHSADLSPDGKWLYVADIGRNCVWVHAVDERGLLSDAVKVTSPRSNDGPRHVWPHPNGKIVYVLQEHSCMVDVFEVNGDDGTLRWVQGRRIIPDDQDEKLFWADEVRTVAPGHDRRSTEPDLLVASTRGLESDTKGYVALFTLTSDGLLTTCHDIWQTPTSGGWANAVEPCGKMLHPTYKTVNGGGARNHGQYVALTCSEQGLVMMLSIDEEADEGKRRVRECARLELGCVADGKIRGAATAVWL